MYKPNKNQFLFTIALLTSFQSPKLLHAFSFEDPFYNIERSFKGMRNSLKNQFYRLRNGFNLNTNQEDQALLKEALEQMSKISPSVEKDEKGTIILTFNIDNVDKNKIDLALVNHLIKGIIPKKYGNFEFAFHSHFVEYGYSVEIKKEIESDPKSDKESIQSKSVSLARQSYYNEKHLPLEVNLADIDSETRGNKLIIRLKPKSYSKLKINHR